MNNLKCSCGGNILACVLSQNSDNYYIKRDGTLYKKRASKQRFMPMEQTIFVCENCHRQKDTLDDFTGYEE